MEGLKDLQTALKQLPENIARRVLIGAANAGAQVIVKEAKQNAPVGNEPHAISKGKNRPKVLPGFLRKNIRRRLNRAAAKEGGHTVTVSVGVSKRAYYWIFHEFEFGGVKHPAHPFLAPAFDAKKEEALQRIKDYLAPRIQKEVEKLRKR